MDLDRIALVQTTFQQVALAPATALFYQRLFEIAPEARPMFKTRMDEQRVKFGDMLTLLVTHLDRPSTIVSDVKALGIRHVGYGVHEDQYQFVGAALLWALEQSLGPAFTPEVRSAWHEAYYVLAGLMKEAAARAPRIAPLSLD